MSPELAGEPEGRSALLLGATGLVGSHCLDLLLRDPAYAAVHVIARRDIGRTHPKLQVRRIDFARLDAAAEQFSVRDVFCCLGTTLARAGSREAFRRVDLEYTVRAGELAAAAGVEHLLVVSAVGANPRSRFFYNRVKGEMEERLRRLHFGALWILRPSLLLGDRGEFRLGERLVTLLAAPLSPLLLGPLRRYRPIAAHDVASAMVTLARASGPGGVLESEEIARVAAGASAPPH